MSSPIPLRDWVVGGLVSLETNNALLAFGQPMVTERAAEFDLAVAELDRALLGRVNFRVHGPAEVQP